MPLSFQKLRKIQKYEDWDFYDDYMVIETNNRLYETAEPTRYFCNYTQIDEAVLREFIIESGNGMDNYAYRG